MSEPLRFHPVVDERGSLLPIELDSVPFAVRRVFVVVGPIGGALRGKHVTTCSEMLCLLGGRAWVSVGIDAGSLGDPDELTAVGQSLLVPEGTYVEYTLADEESSILVLAEQPYESEGRD